MNRPEYISFKDWDILKEKYSSTQLEEYFNINYPYQYLIGNVDFCDNIFDINENVLIPRFETEYLVYKLVEIIKEKGLDNITVLDIGTGSGCIIISLSKLVNGNFDALDVSKKALEVAEHNANKLKSRINFINEDFLKTEKKFEYDVIVSNPPYIADYETVGDSTKYEPQNALFAKNKGLEFYQQIIHKCNAKIFAFEIGCTQKDEVINMVKEKYPCAKVYCEQDFNKLDRYIFVINE